MSKTRLIGRNISFLAMNRVVSMLISFLIFPFMIRHVGKELYGVYVLVLAATSYFGLLDLGVMSALTKYVSEYNGKGDGKTVKSVLNASFTFYCIVGLIMGGLLLLCSTFFYNFFRVVGEDVVVMKQLFTVAALSALLIWPLNTFRGAIQGLNLWNVDATINMLTQALIAVLTFVLLKTGKDIVAVYIAMQSVTMMGGAAAYFIVKKRVGFRVNFPYFRTETFKLMFSYSFFMFLGSILGLVIFQVHNFIIGYYLSMSAVTVYAVAYNIQGYFRSINATIGAPPWTIASEMEGRGDIEGQRMLLLKGTKYLTAVFSPIILITFFFVEPFIKYWMGRGFNDSVLPAKIIILFWIFNGTSELASGILSAKGVVKKPIFIQMAVAVVSIVISVSLIKPLGIIAVALGLTVSMVAVGFPLVLRLALRSLGVTFREYFRRAIKDNIPLYVLVSLLSFTVSKYLYPKTIYLTIFEMSAIYFISLTAYYLVVLKKGDKLDLARLVGLEVMYARFEPSLKKTDSLPK